MTYQLHHKGPLAEAQLESNSKPHKATEIIFKLRGETTAVIWIDTQHRQEMASACTVKGLTKTVECP